MSQTTTAPSRTDRDSDPSIDGTELVHLDPAEVVIGTNVRTDLRPGEKEFRKSIRERGVLEPVTVYRDDAGAYVLLRGQRRTLTAAKVGTPTGTIPVRVVARPDEADRIGDQMVENIHRAGMHEREIVAGVEQLALLGVSTAQIAKRTAIQRPIVDAALAVTEHEQTRARVEAGEVTLDQAAILAEFEDDEAASTRLEQCLSWGRPLEHVAQRLRDEAADRAAYDTEVERLRGEGLPVLTRAEIDAANQAGHLYPIKRLVTDDGEPVPEEQWPTVPGAAVMVDEQWIYPDDTDEHAQGEAGVSAAEATGPTPYQAYVPVWVVTDLDTSSLRTRWSRSAKANGDQTDSEESAEAERERKRAERRTVIANNKAWTSAETVRREWLAQFVTRKSAPKGAEALICEAVLTGQYGLIKSMERHYPMLLKLLDVDQASDYYGNASACADLAAKPTSPKAATMTTLAAVLAAWEDTTGKHTWRNPTPWDARILTALMQWGYEPSDVERVLLGEDAATGDEPTGERPDDD